MHSTIRLGPPRRGGLSLLLMAFACVILLCTLVYGILHEPEHARQMLVERGYTDVRILPRRQFFHACGQSRGVAPGFVATAPDGHSAKGIVCTSPIFGGVVEMQDWE